MKSIKEKEMLVKWAKAMNEPVDPALVEEVEKYQALQKSILESVKQNLVEDLAKASKELVIPTPAPAAPIEFPKLPSLEDLHNLLEEEKNELVQPQAVQEPENTTPTPTKTIADKVVEHITREVKLEEKADSYQQPDAQLPTRSINDLRKKIKFLEDWVSKISLTGPGGGAGDIISLDHPVKLITADYTVVSGDYYIGANAAVSINITIPISAGFPGRMLIIKDESGNCSSNPIVVSGTVDNDTGGFILAQDNGGIQMIYREGWRIV